LDDRLRATIKRQHPRAASDAGTGRCRWWAAPGDRLRWDL